MKKAPLWYSLLPLFFLLLAGGMRFWPEPGTQAMWEEQIGPWLGEAPAGVQVIRENDDLDETFFIIPANPQIKAEALRLFGLGESEWSYYSGLKRSLGKVGVNNTETLRPYLRDSAIEADISPQCLRFFEYTLIFQPIMLERADGTLLISLAYPLDRENATRLTPPHPEYLDEWTSLKSFLKMHYFLFLAPLPAFICCASWLWVRGHSPYHESFTYVCMVIPVISGAMLVMAHLELPLAEPDWMDFLGLCLIGVVAYGSSNLLCTAFMTLLAPYARKPFKRWHA